MHYTYPKVRLHKVRFDITIPVICIIQQSIVVWVLSVLREGTLLERYSWGNKSTNGVTYKLLYYVYASHRCTGFIVEYSTPSKDGHDALRCKNTIAQT
jgi:hypothetical protein